MKLATWNVNSLKVRLPQVLDWLQAHSPDALCLQETKTTDEGFPFADLEQAGYRAIHNGQKTYNGVAIVYHGDALEVVRNIPGLADEQKRVIAATLGDTRVISAYMPNGQEVGSDKYAYKLDWLAKVTAFLAEEIRRHPHLVVLGDFNIAPDDRDVHDPEAWREQVLCSTPEREALRRLFDLGLHDSFRLFHPEGGHYSWWDYRQAAFRRNLGLRIDLVLAADALKPRLKGATIDRTPRTWERPSDHAPALLELSP